MHNVPSGSARAPGPVAIFLELTAYWSDWAELRHELRRYTVLGG